MLVVITHVYLSLIYFDILMASQYLNAKKKKTKNQQLRNAMNVLTDVLLDLLFEK